MTRVYTHKLRILHLTRSPFQERNDIVNKVKNWLRIEVLVTFSLKKKTLGTIYRVKRNYNWHCIVKRWGIYRINQEC